MKKKSPFQWPQLEAGGAAVLPAAGGGAAGVAANNSASAYASGTDWSKVDKVSEWLIADGGWRMADGCLGWTWLTGHR